MFQSLYCANINALVQRLDFKVFKEIYCEQKWLEIREGGNFLLRSKMLKLQMVWMKSKSLLSRTNKMSEKSMQLLNERQKRRVKVFSGVCCLFCLWPNGIGRN